MEQIASHARWSSGGPAPFPETYTTPRVTMGLRALWAGELDAARSILEAVLDHLAERGLYTLATEPHQYLGEIECRAGRYELAARHAATEIEIKLGAGYEELNALDLFPQALVDALRGDVSSAREYATQGLAWSERGDRLYANCNRAVLGFLELSLGRFAQAREHLDPVVRFLREMGVEEPCVIPVHADAIEAQIGMGDLDDAATLLAEFEEQGRTSGRAWALATAARCRALLLAANGDAAAATLTFERALDEHRRVPQPLELARTLLAKGQVERRAKQKSAARRTLQQALGIFEEIGAPLWAARARAELARIGGRAPAGDGLTATERRIADLVAEGKTNKEVADDPGVGRADRRVGPDPDLPQARRPIAHGARPQTHGDSLSKVPGFPRYGAGGIGAMVAACRTSSSSATGRARTRTASVRWPTGSPPAPDR